MRLPIIKIGILLLLLGAADTVGANSLTVTPNSDGSVMIAADYGVVGTVKIDLAFSYSGEFYQPRVIVQGGDYSYEQMARDSRPGLLKLDLAREGEEMQEAAFVLVVDFGEKPGQQPCHVNFVTAAYTSADGRAAFPQVIILPAIEAKAPIKLESASVPAAAASKTVSAQDRPPVSQKVRSSDPAVKSAVADAPNRSSESAVGATGSNLEYRACPDIYQRFRDYQGDRSLDSLVQLFAVASPCTYTQTPAVALSDGESRVVVTLPLSSSLRNAPNIGLSGARVVSLRYDPENTLQVVLLPNTGEHEVVLYVVTDGVLQRIPLVVAPPLALYLKAVKSEELLSPLLDYTITVNYLATSRDTATAADRESSL